MRWPPTTQTTVRSGRNVEEEEEEEEEEEDDDEEEEDKDWRLRLRGRVSPLDQLISAARSTTERVWPWSGLRKVRGVWFSVKGGRLAGSGTHLAQASQPAQLPFMQEENLSYPLIPHGISNPQTSQQNLPTRTGLRSSVSAYCTDVTSVLANVTDMERSGRGVSTRHF